MVANILDDLQKIKLLDRQNMFGSIDNFANDLLDSFQTGQESAKDIENISSIVFFGLGGSATAGEIICQKFLEQSPLPSALSRRSDLPKFVNENTLCIALSYSGNTVETISCYKQAIEKNAHIISITSGGQLEKLSIKNNTSFVKLPAGYQPRAALGLLIGATLGCLYKAKLIENLETIINETSDLLSDLNGEYSLSVPTEKNLAKQIAIEAHHRIPIIYASETLGLAASNRWKNQLNENAKLMAFSNVFPELAHNEIMSDNEESKPVIIYLYNGDEDKITLHANQVALNLMQDQCHKIISVEAKGGSVLQKILSLILLGDYVSAYLAILRGIDPTPVNRITKLKETINQQNKINEIATLPLRGSSRLPAGTAQ